MLDPTPAVEALDGCDRIGQRHPRRRLPVVLIRRSAVPPSL